MDVSLRVVHLVRAPRSAPAHPDDTVIAISRDGQFYRAPGADAPPGPIEPALVVAMLFEHDGVVVW